MIIEYGMEIEYPMEMCIEVGILCVHILLICVLELIMKFVELSVDCL